MTDISIPAERRAFVEWLRTGRWRVADPDNVELKFNPYHDPRDGRFTFAPGGPRSLGHVIISDRRGLPSVRAADADSRGTTAHRQAAEPTQPPPAGGPTHQSGQNQARFQPAAFSRAPVFSRGNNARAFDDPMTLEPVFRGLSQAPGGAIIALTDNILDITGPGRETTTAMSLARTNVLINQIRTLDPNYRIDSLGFPQTLQGQANQIRDLRFDRAAAFLRFKNELRPMQVETLRFIQQATDRAYARGQVLLRNGKLPVRLSDQEALGNYIDRRVRVELRERFGKSDIDWGGEGPIRVNRRENDRSGDELTFRRPDARVGKMAYDVTLASKTLKTAQICGFFATDFRPSHVIIIRPSQLGGQHTYIIVRPEISR